MIKNKTASLLIIGNEILSGRTQDKNLNYIAKKLSDIGIDFSEARVVKDIHEEIASAVNDLRSKYDYVFTTGGIGPTHDDITTESIALAFGVQKIKHPDAVNALENYYNNKEAELNDARLRMAEIPEGAELIENPLTAAPGYKKDNVFVLAGIPSIMQLMFDFTLEKLDKGRKMFSRTISCDLIEGDIAKILGDIQESHEETEIGSYPFVHENKFAVSIVIRSFDESAIDVVSKKVKEFILNNNGNIIE